MHNEGNAVLDSELSPEVIAYLRQREGLVAKRLQEEVRHCEDWNSSQDLLLRRLVEQQSRTEGSLAELQESMASQGEDLDEILAAISDGPQKSSKGRSRKEVAIEPDPEPPKAGASLAGHGSPAPEATPLQSAPRVEAEQARSREPAGPGLFSGWLCATLWRNYSETTVIGRIVTSSRFETLCGCVICLNAAFIGYAGNYAIDNLENPRNTFIRVCEYLFFSFYATELLLKLAVLRLNFFTNADMLWNIFDLVLVMQATYDIIYEAAQSGNDEGGGDLTWMRLLRLLKMLKMLRMVRVMRAFRELRLMLRSVTGSITVLFWSMVMLFLVMYVFGLVFLQAATAYLSETPIDKLDDDTVAGIEDYWGSLGLAILTLYMVITGGYDWAEIAEPLKTAGELYYILFLLYVAALTFAILNILTGIFAEAAMKIRQGDQENVIHEEMNRDKSTINDIKKLFRKLDNDNSKTIMWEEFRAHLDDKHVRAFFNTLEIDASDAKGLFDLLGNGERGLTCQKFIDGCAKYKGAAKSIDIISLAHETKKFSSDMDLFMQFFEERCYHLQRWLTGSPKALPVQPLEIRFAAAGCKQQKKDKKDKGAAELAAEAEELIKADL